MADVSGPAGSWSCEEPRRWLAFAWEQVLSALNDSVACMADPAACPGSVKLVAATTRLRQTASQFEDLAHGLGTTGTSGLPGQPIRALAAAISAPDEGLPAPGTPRAEWRDAQVLLAAAYRLADLADALGEGFEPDIYPADLATSLDAAHIILNAAE